MELVTGGTGLVGSHLLYDLVFSGKKVRALRRKTSDIEWVEKVFSYYNENSKELFERIEWVEGDMLDIFSLEKALEGIDKVYHCAAMVSFDPSDADKLMHVNIQGTANLVNVCLEKNIEKFAMISSIAALGRAVDGQYIDERSQWKASKNNTAYAISKFNSEREVWRASEEGLPVVIVNPSLIIGPGDWSEGSAQFFSTVWDGFPFYSEGVNGFVDVRDVARATIFLMDSEVVNERFILNSENISYKVLLSKVAESLGKKPPGFRVNRLMGQIAWRIEKIRTTFTGKNPLITKETAKTAVGRYYYSSKKIREKIKFEFMPMEKSIMDTGKIFRSEHQNSSR